MKQTLKIAACILFAGTVVFVSCKKEKPVSSVVIPPPPPPSPSSASVQFVAQLIPIGTLSQARDNVVAAAAGNKILFAGGWSGHACYDSVDGGWMTCMDYSSRVDIYDTNNHTWSSLDLNRYYFKGYIVAILGNKIFFAGGSELTNAGYQFSDKVDVYDASGNSWSTAHLSETRYGMTAVTLGNKLFIVGGQKIGGGVSTRIDIYDASANSWSTAELPIERTDISAASIENKLLFAGGQIGTSFTNRVDIYDVSSNTWSISSLSEARVVASAVTLGNKVFFAGGNLGNGPSARVDIYDNATQSWSQANVNFYNHFFDACTIGGRILFFAMVNGTSINVYEASTDKWSVVNLSQSIINPAITASGNQVYITGWYEFNSGYVNGVWKVQF